MLSKTGSEQATALLQKAMGDRKKYNARAGARGKAQLESEIDRITESYGSVSWTGKDGVVHDVTSKTVHQVLRVARASGIKVSDLIVR